MGVNRVPSSGGEVCSLLLGGAVANNTHVIPYGKWHPVALRWSYIKSSTLLNFKLTWLNNCLDATIQFIEVLWNVGRIKCSKCFTSIHVVMSLRKNFIPIKLCVDDKKGKQNLQNQNSRIKLRKLGNPLPGSHFLGARDSRSISFPYSREWNHLDSWEQTTTSKTTICGKICASHAVN